MSMFRRKRRTRPSSERQLVVQNLTNYIWKNDAAFRAVVENTPQSRRRVFGKVLNKWLDSSRESLIDRYVDDAAYDMAWHAINTVRKQIEDQKE